MATGVPRKSVVKKGLLSDYVKSLDSSECKERYLAKLTYINNLDPYEIPRENWCDDVDLWPFVTYIHVGMYLLFSQSAYTKEQLMNYKSLDCYQRFASGWVREILVKKFDDKRVLIAKVQAQLFCTGSIYCDFVLWTQQSMFIQRIAPGPAFWEENVRKLTEFVMRGILPELLGRWFSKPPKTNTPNVETVQEQFCYCGEGEESGDMVGCDNKDCPFKWFHFKCLKITTAPKSKKWFCPDCQKLKKSKNNRPIQNKKTTPDVHNIQGAN